MLTAGTRLGPALNGFTWIALIVLVASQDLGASQTPAAPPSTDIFLALLTKKGGQLEVGTPTNVTKRAGYDNQPAFLPEGRALLFSSARDGKPTDIYRYDIAKGTHERLTDTPDGEYSPTETPDGRFFSVIRQGGGSAIALVGADGQ